MGMTCIGVLGMVLLANWRLKTAVLLLAVYRSLGLDSPGHYAVASFTDHDAATNTTILLEVSAATVFLTQVVKLCLTRRQSKPH